VPLTLLGLPDDVEIGVIEMGTDRPGEIAALATIVRPDAAVITSIGEEHLELLGDLDGVLTEETSVLESLDPSGKAFVAEDPETLPRRAREMIGRNRVRVAGMRESSDLRPDGGEKAIHVLEDGSTLWRWRGIDVRLPIPGNFNIRNALLALGVAMEYGVAPADAIGALAKVKLPKLRGEWVRYGDLRVLADCYNSNPPSLDAAIDILGSLPSRGRRIAVLGTMRELGPTSEQLHAAAADRIATLVGDRIDLVVATGDFARAFEGHAQALGDCLVMREDPLEAYEAVRPMLRPSDTILLKASRGEQMERWLSLLESAFS
jgi:UDP-N-acetylmuramoyl-tripeptide--D-alanyl-D-alanine ligase